MANHIFISYSREDQTYTRRLVDSLRQRGFDVWVDDRIDFGDRWWQTIVQAIRASGAFIVVMTPEAERSQWVERELLLALKEGKPIFSLLLRGEEFPILINAQHADVRSGQMPPEGFYDRLRRVLPIAERIAPSPQSSEPEMVLIPAGEFLMGSDPGRDRQADDNELPQHTLHLPDYYLAKTPVTNAQYAVFVRAARLVPPDHWTHGSPPAGKEDHPVVYVSWHKAIAYCNWLSQVTGKPYRLPSEAEWEKGARGTDGRIYPWGDEPPNVRRCNFGGNVGGTTPVGRYSPQGDSPYGCVDMAGNVWEWTRNLWGEDEQKPYFGYPYSPGDGREDLKASADILRVVRGGSWGGGQRSTRCARRYRDIPDGLSNSVGFRVVVSRAPG